MVTTLDLAPAREQMTLALDYAEDVESDSAAAQHALKQATTRSNPEVALTQAEKRLLDSISDAEMALVKVREAKQLLESTEDSESAVFETDAMLGEDG